MIKFTDEQRMIKETVRQLAKKEIARLAVEADKKGSMSGEIVGLLSGIDLLNIALPEKFGGIDADYTTTAAAVSLKDYPLERMMRDAKMIQIFDGSNQIQRVIVAKCLLP